MKKIIAALDGLKFSDSTKEYAIAIAKHSNTHLVGVFLDDRTYTSYKIYDLVIKEGVSEKKLKEYDEKDNVTRRRSVESFEVSCRKAALNYSVHHDKNVALQELLHESIYADLLVIDRSETLMHYEEKTPTRFIRDLLTNVQCPVFLAPRKYRTIEKLVLLYDGEPSSVHAIKMFSYMLPQLKNLPVEVISVKGLSLDQHLPDNKLMREFMKRHYPDAEFTVLKGLAETAIVDYLKRKKENNLIILGAYRRGTVSRWFRPSMADILMNELKDPLFIAHSR